MKITRPMNGEEFYEEFKEAIKFLGLGWHEKDKIFIALENKEEVSSFVMSFGGRSAMFECTVEEFVREKT